MLLLTAISIQFVVAEISWKFPFYARNFSYYAGIMLYAFQPLLCLKLCRHNQHKPNLDISHNQ